MDDLARDVGCFIRCKEFDDRSDLVWSGHASQRDFGEQPFALRGGEGGIFKPTAGLVHPDTGRSVRGRRAWSYEQGIREARAWLAGAS